MFTSFPLYFEGGISDLILSFPDQCLPFYYTELTTTGLE